MQNQYYEEVLALREEVQRLQVCLITQACWQAHFLLITSGRIFCTPFKNTITASSQFDANHAPSQSLLFNTFTAGKSAAWCALNGSSTNWITMIFDTKRRILAVKTQGRHACAQWVTKYRIDYFREGDPDHAFSGHFATSPGSASRIFDGNFDQDTVVAHYLGDQNISTTKVRLVIEGAPDWYHGHPSLRWDVVFE